MIHLPQIEKRESPKILSDPRIIGPGIWVTIHIKARKAQTEKLKQDFVDYMTFLSESFPCEKCRGHIQEYIKANPFSHLWNLQKDGEEIGMFKWSWLFHNSVNLRIHKPYMDWITAWKMYELDQDNGITPCTGNCGSSTEEKKVDSHTEQIIKSYFTTN